jgi:HAE1 family hydrophobic/amphiphilic exporter-1
MSKFFINRPIVAMVIAILTVIVGAVAVAGLPVAQFPSIAPPEVQVSAIYIGADAQTIEQAVATPIEQQMSGVDNANYMYSLNATANGQMRLIVDFDVATDPNTDLILAQSRETQAASQLPVDVTNYGITVQKSVLAPLMLIALYSPRGTHDAQFLANYAYINLNDPLTRVKGVGTTQIFGSGQYAMRLWVKPDQLAKLQITVPEIVSAIQTQNTVNPAGQVGSEPIPKGQPFTYAVRAQGRLTTPEEFEQVVLRETPETGIVRVRNVARVELGSQDYSVTGHLNGKPSAVIGVYQ